jgi:hypothetical protein
VKFMCLAYSDRGLTPGPDVAAQYQLLGQAMRQAGAYVDTGQLAASSESKSGPLEPGRNHRCQCRGERTLKAIRFMKGARSRCPSSRAP